MTCTILWLAAVLGATGDEPSTSDGVSHVMLARLGNEHLAQATHRRAGDGGRIVAWGDRILEWKLDQPATTEVVATRPGLEYSNGGCALDVDGDGVDEIVVARGRGRSVADPELLWFQERPGQKTWSEHRIGTLGKSPTAPHDIRPIAIRRPHGEVVRGVVAVLDRRRLVWFRIRFDPAAPWERHEIGTLPRESQSGMAIGDVNGDGHPDVVCGMYWAECPEDLTRESWTLRRFGEWEARGWGGMAKLALVDMDGDGRPEIVASQAEIPGSQLGIFRRDPAKPDALWAYLPVDHDLYCPHSLVVVDLDGDGRPDILVGEMKAGGWEFPMNPRPRILAYSNRGDGRFVRRVLAEGLGVHEMGIAPERRDGKWLIYAADEIQRHKFPDMVTHVSYWLIDPAAGRGGTPSGGR